MKPAIEGGCLCGGFRYRLEDDPWNLNDCHCIDCRRSSGAPFVTWGTVKRSDLIIRSGAARTVAHAERIRSFAACCGTPVFFADTHESETIDVTIASLDDPRPFPPEVAIWTEDRLPWVRLDDTRPVYVKDRRHG